MPYMRAGNKIMVKKDGKWKVKQVAKDLPSAKKALKLLSAIEHGNFKPTGKDRQR
jgi:hypothetical protein